MAAFEILAGAVVLALALYYYMTSTADFFAQRGIPYLEPMPFIGSSANLILSRKWPGLVLKDFYQHAKAQGHKFLGIFFGRRPIVLVCDVDMAKEVLVKDFQYVMDRGTFTDRKNEPLTANLFNLAGQEWKTLRHKISPTFTTSKMKAMFHLVKTCTEGLVEYIEAQVRKGGEMEMAEVMAKYSTDVIGTCAFGIEAQSLKVEDAEFRAMGRKFFEPTRMRVLLRTIAEVVPGLRRIIPVPIIPPDVSAFFTRTFNENVRHREQNKVVRHDFVDLLIQLKNNPDNKSSGEDNGIDTDILPAQAFIFFLAGFETSSGVTSACLMELAHHPEIQERVRAEVDRVLEKHGGVVTFEALQEMTYMEQCLEETMRLYPALGALLRVTTRNYQLPGEDPKAVLPAGTRVFVPIYAIHRDPDFYPDPDRFDPERFTEENKQGRPHYAYMPFGEGPRICIGLRFAMMQMKTSLSMILKSYRVVPSAKSAYPLQIEPKSLVIKIKGGNCLKMVRRDA